MQKLNYLKTNEQAVSYKIILILMENLELSQAIGLYFVVLNFLNIFQLIQKKKNVSILCKTKTNF